MPSIHNNKLSACPRSPNCVGSDSQEKRHAIEPYRLGVRPEKAWAALHEVTASLPRMAVISAPRHYLHAEARSRVFRFIDDVEFQLRPRQGIIAVRSAARSGYYDFGVNRKRIENIRAILHARGVVQ